jgi:hypothetical protein
MHSGGGPSATLVIQRDDKRNGFGHMIEFYPQVAHPAADVQ